jgi:hypothetical protein
MFSKCHSCNFQSSWSDGSADESEASRRPTLGIAEEVFFVVWSGMKLGRKLFIAFFFLFFLADAQRLKFGSYRGWVDGLVERF